MKTSTAVLLTAAVFAGGQAAFWLWQNSSNEPATAENHQPAPSATLPQSKPKPRTIISTAPPAGSASKNLVARSTSDPTSSLYSKPSGYIKNLAPESTPVDPDAPMSREELARRAQAVQDHTQNRLETLTRDLNLTEDQQDYLFGVIAKASPSYVPALSIGYTGGGTTSSGGGGNFTPIDSGSNARSSNGSNIAANTTKANSAPTEPPTKTLNDQIYEVLAEDQQDILEEEIMDRDRWWADIIGELEEEHDEIVNGTSVVTPPETGDTDPDQAITTGEDGGSTEETNADDNLFDLLN
ncbi:MAG: hypothetical protein P8J87_20580 [Verrucomicrobiales bacterium]|nr:hypothetical protein [Verrucomicrobiales bacterium]